MIEFGSDYHYIAPSNGEGKTLYDCFPLANLYADGRQAIIHLYKSLGWRRLWVPEYYCYDVVESLRSEGLDIWYYDDYPGNHDDTQSLEKINKGGYFRPTDAVLRVNYFGTRSYRSPELFPIAAVVEDHTHDLIGGWSINSRADWCIASLRKTLPIPEGGMLWSPRGLVLPTEPESNVDNESVAEARWDAMRLKARYLAGEKVKKAGFRAGFVDTEPYFDSASVSSLDERSKEYLKSFDVQDWYQKKRDNWESIRDIHKDGVHVLNPENLSCNPFSLILLFDNIYERDRVRKALIEKQVYPAILWSAPSFSDGRLFFFSRSMLSIHCDARYSKEDIMELKTIIESVL